MNNHNPFKEIGHPPEKVPPELKEKIMDDVSAFLLFMDIATLFSANYTEAIKSFFKERKKKGRTNKT